jgi:hypothetical protein
MEPERRTRGVLRISMHSIIKALYGDTDYKAISMRISKEDRNMIDITVSHPDLPEWKQGQKLQRVNIERRYEQDGK